MKNSETVREQLHFAVRQSPLRSADARGPAVKNSSFPRGEFPHERILKIKGKTLRIEKTLIMGALNLTPDSFYAASRCSKSDALKRVEKMLRDGADIIDIGAESTRPGSLPVSEDEETRRLIPVIERCAKFFPDAVFSADTTKSAVARRALESGASMINDISAMTFDPEMVATVARSEGAVVLSHTPARPAEMQSRTDYKCVVSDVAEFLKKSVERAVAAGIERQRIVVDPGIGFGKTAAQNVRILARLERFLSIGRPLLVGTSRKSFIGRTLGGLAPEERLEGTAATVAIAVMKGASMVRVHDVREMARVAKMSDAVAIDGAGF